MRMLIGASGAPDFAQYGTPISIHEKVNIPPLFDKDANLISDKKNLYHDVNPYDVVVTNLDLPFYKALYQKYSVYAAFSLRVNRGPFGDSLDDNAELRLDFAKYYFPTKFFKDVVGLEPYMDKTLLDVRDQLPKEGW